MFVICLSDMTTAKDSQFDYNIQGMSDIISAFFAVLSITSDLMRASVSQISQRNTHKES